MRIAVRGMWSAAASKSITARLGFAIGWRRGDADDQSAIAEAIEAGARRARHDADVQAQGICHVVISHLVISVADRK